MENFRNFAASHLKLYYKSEMIRLFISSLASTKLVIYKVYQVQVRLLLLMHGENS